MDLAAGTAGLADKRNRKIGCELGISEIAVKAYRGQVMRKMSAIPSRRWP
ncbi:MULTISPECIES: LuxR C-terminal-related transcriptional regulator [Rhizobium]|nr:LuxR C-terminal-related transcriptional regulator [Rhizobium miluonense]